MKNNREGVVSCVKVKRTAYKNIHLFCTERLRLASALYSEKMAFER